MSNKPRNDSDKWPKHLSINHGAMMDEDKDKKDDDKTEKGKDKDKKDK